ncbi:MAG: hypothetical protein JWN86_1740 [Planctomycetota bacterium]|nr:hypothetical protein [Planctomycetota bacterium]
MLFTSDARADKFHLSRLLSYDPPPSERNAAHWRINGYGATIFIWTAAEWELLEERPSDAQYYPCGIWCALRLDGPT